MKKYKFEFIKKVPFRIDTGAGRAIIKRRKCKSRPDKFAVVGYIGNKIVREYYSSNGEMIIYAWFRLDSEQRAEQQKKNA